MFRSATPKTWTPTRATTFTKARRAVRLCSIATSSCARIRRASTARPATAARSATSARAKCAARAARVLLLPRAPTGTQGTRAVIRTNVSRRTASLTKFGRMWADRRWRIRASRCTSRMGPACKSALEVRVGLTLTARTGPSVKAGNARRPRDRVRPRPGW